MTEERAKELFKTEGAGLAICVGSWKAYNEDNDHAYGSYYNGRYYVNFDELEGCYNFDEFGWLANYITIDYEAMARDDDYIYEYNNGILVIY